MVETIAYNVGETTAYGDSDIPDEVYNKVLKLEENLVSCAEQHEELCLLKNTKENELQDLRKKSGFRDRYLGGYFGGNRERTEKLQLLKEEVQNYSEEIEDIEENQLTTEKQIYSTISNYIETVNDEFAEVNSYYKVLDNLHTVCESYSPVLDCTLLHLKGTGALECADMFLPGIGSSIISFGANYLVKKDVEAVKGFHSSFTATLDEYTDYLKHNSVQQAVSIVGQEIDVDSVHVDDTLDLMADVLTKSISFSGIVDDIAGFCVDALASGFTLYKVVKAHKKLSDVKECVDDVRETINEPHNAISTYIHTHVDHIRELINSE